MPFWTRPGRHRPLATRGRRRAASWESVPFGREAEEAAQPEAEAALLQVRCTDLVGGRVGVRVVVLGVFGDAQVAVAQLVLDAAAEVRFWERVRRDNEAEEDGTHYFLFFVLFLVCVPSSCACARRQLSMAQRFSNAERPGTSKKSLVRPMRPLAATAAEGLDARGRRLAKPREEVEGACASRSGEGLLNKVN